MKMNRVSHRIVEKTRFGNVRSSVAIVVASILCLAVLGCKRQSTDEGPESWIGAKIGEVDLVPLGYPDLDSVPADVVLKQLPPNVTIVHLWGTWCPPCRAEYPELSNMVTSISDPNFQFVSLSCEGEPGQTYAGLSEKTNSFLSGNKIASMVYCDPAGTTRLALKSAAGKEDFYYPTSILLDKNRSILAIWEGFDPANLPKMETAIRSALAAR